MRQIWQRFSFCILFKKYAKFITLYCYITLPLNNRKLVNTAAEDIFLAMYSISQYVVPLLESCRNVIVDLFLLLFEQMGM